MSHTPGPWWVEDSDHPMGEGREVYDGFGRTASVYGDSPTAEANARLIAAAPEMLAALKVWLELETTCDGRRPCYCEDPEIAKHGKCYACMAVNAIAKAEGRDDV